MRIDDHPIRWMLIYIVSAVIIALVICSCKSTEYVPVETIRNVYHNTTDTIRDSIRHSVYVNQYVKGDTVFKERVESLYVDKWRVHDSIVVEHDSIPYPVEVVKTVQKPIPMWHYIIIGIACLIITLKIKKILKS